jgi:hypothetical protein
MSALKKYHIPLPGALLVLLAFFLPWVSVGCDELMTVEASGYDLAGGNLFSEIGSLLGQESAAIDPGNFAVLWLVPVAAVLSLALLAITWRRPDTENRTSLGHIVAGLLGLAALVFLWFQTRGGGDESELAAMAGEFVKLKYGVWLTVAGLLIIVGGGVLSWLAARRSPPGYVLPTPGAITQSTSAPGYIGVLPDGGRSTTSSADNFPPITAQGAFDAVAPRRTTEVIEKGQPAGMAWLVIKDGPRTGHSFRLLETTTIGSDAGNDIIIDDSALSSQHAKVKFEDSHRFMIYDLASTNGMFFFDSARNNWEPVHRHELADGQQIKLGRTVLHFMTLSTSEAAQQAATTAS